MNKIKDLIGKTFTKIDINKDQTEINFSTENKTYKMFLYLSCQETMDIENIDGDLNNLLNNPILKAEEILNINIPKKYNNLDCILKKYKLSTIKGFVIINWFGSFNSYYPNDINKKANIVIKEYNH